MTGGDASALRRKLILCKRLAAVAVLMASLPPALNVFVIAPPNEGWVEEASVAVLIGTFAFVVALTA